MCIRDSYTDSLSALQSLSSSDNRSHPTVWDILILARNLACQGYAIMFCWIPAHVGIVGNEQADISAKYAVETLSIPLPLSDVKISIKNIFYEKWKNMWALQEDNKLHNIKPNIDVWPSLTKRKMDVVLTRLRIGHCRLTHKHLFLKELSPICTHCNTTLSVKHILMDCSAFNTLRFNHFGSSFCILDLLGMVHHPNLFTFLHDVGVLHRI